LVGVVHGHNGHWAVSVYEDFWGLEIGHVGPRSFSNLMGCFTDFGEWPTIAMAPGCPQARAATSPPVQIVIGQ
jgi:hypothetical protein